jgi:hypothetical protein
MECEFGPQDKSRDVLEVTEDMMTQPQKYTKKGKNVPNGRGKKKPRLTAAMKGGSRKRGCKCAIYVRQLYYLRDVAQIVLQHPRHTNADGLIVHGIVKEGERSRFTSQLSPETRAFVEENLRLGVPISKIKTMHIELVLRLRAQGAPASRDHFMKDSDIRNVAVKVNQAVYQKHENDAESVRMWVQANRNIVFYYQELNSGSVSGALNGDNMPFVIGIQTDFMFRMMLEHGHKSAVSIDATFGTNEKKVLGALHVSFFILKPIQMV